MFVFTMQLLCADSGPWRKMSRARPPTSAIMTSSGSTCPSHQESAWGAAEARQKKVTVEVVRKAIVCQASICWTHLQTFSVSTVLGKKASTVEQSWGEGANLPGRRSSPYWTGGGTVNESIMFGELSILLLIFFFLRNVHGCVGTDVWVKKQNKTKKSETKTNRKEERKNN